jgi:GNAT superfamily N-acetyltransferase
MHTIEEVLGGAPHTDTPFLLRSHEPGDMGWVIERHGAVYAEEYGWDATFEALVAQICADFVTRFDAARERCWIAEMNGKRVGCVFVVKADEATSKLRLLLVEPEARGLGLGGRLVDECVAFARASGATTLTLWTNSILTAARHIYEARGFTLKDAEPHHSFGHDLVGEHWDLALR